MSTKVALITGASSDIGASLVKELLAAGVQVYAQYYANAANLAAFEYHPNFNAIKHDLSSAEEAAGLIDKVITHRGQLDFLVNAIGPLHHKPLCEITPNDWEAQIHFNLNLPFYLVHHAQALLIKSQGHVINFAFAGAETLTARANSVPYCAAKAGIIILTKSLAASLAPQGVRVNAISPGLIEKGAIESPERQLMAASIPWGRPGTPEEVAAVLRWLLCSSPAYITGVLVPVAGAWEYI